MIRLDWIDYNKIYWTRLDSADLDWMKLNYTIDTIQILSNDRKMIVHTKNEFLQIKRRA